MTEYDNSQAAASVQGSTGSNLGAGVIDVLIRNLETAKAEFLQAGNANFDELAASGPVFCTLIYATPGQICPFFYYHSLTGNETVQ